MDSKQRALAEREADPIVKALRLRIADLEEQLAGFAYSGYVANGTWCDSEAFGDDVADAQELLKGAFDA